MILNWLKLLHRAWKDYSKKNNHEYVSSYVTSFSKTYKARLAVIERHLKRRDYNFGKWRATLIPKKDGGNRPLIIPISTNDKLVLKAVSDYLSDSLAFLLSVR